MPDEFDTYEALLWAGRHQAAKSRLAWYGPAVIPVDGLPDSFWCIGYRHGR
jgi:hypothetical protein